MVAKRTALSVLPLAGLIEIVFAYALKPRIRPASLERQT